MSTMLHPLRLWYEAETGQPAPVGSATCWLCALSSPDTQISPEMVSGAIHADLGRLAQGVFSNAFTDHDKGRGGSAIVCPACAAYFAYVVPEKRTGKGGASGKLFTYHLRVFRSHWQRWDREQMGDDLLTWLQNGIPEDGCLGVTYSHKKHTIPWARPLMAGSRQLWVRLDGADVCVQPTTFPPMLAAMATLWSRGYSKRLLAEGQLHPTTLARSQIPAVDLATVAIIRPHVGSPLPAFAAYCCTEENRDRYTRQLAAVLPGPRSPQPASRPLACTPQCGRRSRAEKSVSPAVVADARRARQTRRPDQRNVARVEQFDLFSPRR